MDLIKQEPSSFRDKSGQVFYYKEDVYRSVHESYAENYKLLMNSGLFAELLKTDLIIPHKEAILSAPVPESAFTIIKPERIETIVYPSEWCFSQLKDAALCTLEIQLKALEYGMILKDASAYNIQYHKGKPLLIDTLSFETYVEGQTWDAYRQFCQHFLAPLLLMKYKDPGANSLQQIYIDGIPLQLASKLLPFKTRFNFSILSHIHLHAASQRKHEDNRAKITRMLLSKKKLVMLIQSLHAFTKKLQPSRQQTTWGTYYDKTNYSVDAFNRKEILVETFGQMVKPAKVIDLGANDGTFSRIFSRKGITVISLDSDTQAVENNYCRTKLEDDVFLMPLCADITNPTPGTGWENKERKALLQRLNGDLTLALALIHHLVFGHNISFEMIAKMLPKLSPYLIIEFIPKQDSQVVKMLLNRKDVFDDYTQSAFEKAFEKHYNLLKKENILDTERCLYLYSKKNPE